MHSGIRHIMYCALCLAGISMLYFMGLVAGVPFAATIVAVLAFAGLLFFWLWNGEGDRLADKYGSNSRFVVIVILIGVCLIVKNSNAVAVKYGGWDAWAQWNCHARIIASQAQWKNLFLNVRFDHPDYPLFLPSAIAFIARVCGGYNLLIPHILSFFFTLSIPLVIFIDVSRHRRWLAVIVLLLLACDRYYLERGVSQYADTPLAFFFLCASVCRNHILESKKIVALCGAFLGCCMWTKNEGIVLAPLFMLFNTSVLFNRRHLVPFLSGIAAPLLVLLLFKTAYAPANDMVGGQSGSTLRLALQPDRYKMIYTSMQNNLQVHFIYLVYATLLYLAMCMVRKVMPGRQFFMLLACMVVYNQIYSISVLDLAYHLGSSHDRLMHQLMPCFLYVVAVSWPQRTAMPFPHHARH